MAPAQHFIGTHASHAFSNSVLASSEFIGNSSGRVWTVTAGTSEHQGTEDLQLIGTPAGGSEGGGRLAATWRLRTGV